MIDKIKSFNYTAFFAGCSFVIVFMLAMWLHNNWKALYIAVVYPEVVIETLDGYSIEKNYQVKK